MADKNLRLNMILSMVDKATSPVQKFTKQNEILGAKIKETQQELNRLGQTNDDIAHFRTLKKDSEATAAALAKMQQKGTALAKQLKATKAATQKLNSQFSESESQVTTLTQQQQKQRQSLNKVDAALQKARKRHAELTEQMQGAENPTRRLTQALQKNAQTITQLEAAQVEECQALKQLDKALVNAKQRTKELGQQIKQTTRPTNKMTREFEKTTAEVRRLEAAQQSERVNLQKVRAELEKAGVSTRHLNRATKDITRQSAKYTAQLTKQRDELADVTQRQKELQKIIQRNKNIRMGAAVDAVGVSAAFYAVERLSAAYGDVANAQGEIQSLGIDTSGIESITRAARDFSNEWAGTTQAEFIRASYDIKSGISSLGDDAVGEFTRIAALTAGATKSSTAEMTSLFAAGYGIYRKQFDQFGASTIAGWERLSAQERDMKFGEYFSAGIASSVQAFRTDGQNMSDAISNLGAAATSANVPFAEQLSVLGQLQASMSGSEAATKYRAFLTGAAKASNDLGLSFIDANNNLRSMPEILEELRGHYGDTIDALEEQELKKAFGTDEAIGLIKLLYPEIGQLKQNIDGLNGSLNTGTAVTEKMAANILKGPGQAFPLMVQQIGNLSVAVGELFSPAILVVANVLGFATTALSAFVEHVPILPSLLAYAVTALVAFKAATIVSRVALSLYSDALIWNTKIMAMFNMATLKSNALLAVNRVRSIAATAGIVAMAVASKGVAVSMAVMTAAQWALNAALAANPIGLVIIGITALVGAAAYLVKEWGSIADFFSGLWDSVTAIFRDAWANIDAMLAFSPLGLLMGAWSGVVQFFRAIWADVTTPICDFFNWLSDTLSFNPLSILSDAWSSVIGFFSGLWQGVATDTGAGMEDVKSALAYSPLPTLSGAWSSVTGFFSGLWQGVATDTGAGMEDVKSALAYSPLSALTGAWSSVTGFFSGLWQGVATDTGAGIENVKSALAYSPLPTLTGAWSSVTGFFSGLWQGVGTDTGAGMEDVKSALSYSPLPTLTGAWSGVTSFFSGLWEGVVTDTGAGIEYVKSALAYSPLPTLASAWSGVTDMFDDVYQRLTSQFDSVSTWWDGLFANDIDVNVQARIKEISNASQVALSVLPPLSAPEVNPQENTAFDVSGREPRRPASFDGIPAATSMTVSNHYSYGDVIVHAQDNATAADIAREIQRQMDQRERESVQRSRGRLID